MQLADCDSRSGAAVVQRYLVPSLPAVRCCDVALQLTYPTETRGGHEFVKEAIWTRASQHMPRRALNKVSGAANSTPSATSSPTTAVGVRASKDSPRSKGEPRNGGRSASLRIASIHPIIHGSWETETQATADWKATTTRGPLVP
jgi:hypothetical protein